MGIKRKIKHVIKKHEEEGNDCEGIDYKDWDVDWDEEGIAFYFKGQRTKCYFLHKNGHKEYLSLDMEVVALNEDEEEEDCGPWSYHFLVVSEDANQTYGEFDSKEDGDEVFAHAKSAMLEADRVVKRLSYLNFLDYNKINKRIKKDKDIVEFKCPKK